MPLPGIAQSGGDACGAVALLSGAKFLGCKWKDTGAEAKTTEEAKVYQLTSADHPSPNPKKRSLPSGIVRAAEQLGLKCTRCDHVHEPETPPVGSKTNWDNVIKGVSGKGNFASEKKALEDHGAKVSLCNPISSPVTLNGAGFALLLVNRCEHWVARDSSGYMDSAQGTYTKTDKWPHLVQMVLFFKKA